MQNQILSKFNVYDQVGYLMVGSISLIVLYLDSLFLNIRYPKFDLNSSIIWLIVTYFLGHILKEFYNKFKDIGVLILNLGKGKQEGFFKADRVLKYGSPEFHLSYFYEGEYLDRALQETASYLIASLGLGSPCDKILYNVMKSFIRVDGALPRSLEELFKEVKIY